MKMLGLLLFFAGSFCTGQPVVEVRYRQPVEAAGAGYLEKDQQYVLWCNDRKSVFFADPHEGSGFSEPGYPDTGSRPIFGQQPAGWIFKDRSLRRLTQSLRSVQNDPYLVEEELYPMEWKILEENKRIRGIQVVKARCQFRGRFYSAWFAPSIPIGSGPWKLGGLPGLILEAYDDRKEVVFFFGSLRLTGLKQVPRPASRGRKVSLKTFRDLNQKEIKQFLEFLEARLAGSNMGFRLDIRFRSYPSWEILK